MTTVSEEIAQRIAASAQPVVDTVFDGIQEAEYYVRRLARKPKSGMTTLLQPQHSKLATDIYRYYIYTHLESNPEELGDWTLNVSVRMNSITVHNGLQTIKVFHTNRRDVIPAAGRNDVRVNYYSSEFAAADPDALLAGQNLILTWQRWRPTAPLRLVHPLTAGSYSQNPKIDFSCFMERSTEDFSGAEYTFDQRGVESLEDYDATAFGDLTGTEE